jgi:hypothetical protein
MPDIFISQSSQRDPRIKTETTPNTAEPVFSEGEIPAQITDTTPLDTLQKNTMHMFTAFKEMPDRVCFQSQEDGEIILLFLRRNFVTNISWLFSSFVFGFLPFLFYYAVQLSLAPVTSIPPNYIFVLFIFYYLILGTIVFINFITWYFNIMLVTTARIIDINFADLVYKNIAETKISLVQDVSYTQVGVIRALFDYGDVLIQTAGALDNFDFKAVSKPERVVQIVEGLIGQRGKQNP